MPKPPKRRENGYKIATIVLAALTFLVLVANAGLICQGHELARNDQRAWVGAIQPNVPLIPDVFVKPSVTLKNFGHGPALRVTSSVHLRSRPSSEAFSPDAPASENHESCGALPPGEQWTAQPPSPVVFTQRQIDAIIKSQTYILYVYGEIGYEDVFGESGETTYAYKWLPTIQTWQVLGMYNNMK